MATGRIGSDICDIQTRTRKFSPNPNPIQTRLDLKNKTRTQSNGFRIGFGFIQTRIIQTPKRVNLIRGRRRRRRVVRRRDDGLRRLLSLGLSLHHHPLLLIHRRRRVLVLLLLLGFDRHRSHLWWNYSILLHHLHIIIELKFKTRVCRCELKR